MHLVWCHLSHLLHWIPFWFQYTGYSHFSQGNLRWGPGLASMSPAITSERIIGTDTAGRFGKRHLVKSGSQLRLQLPTNLEPCDRNHITERCWHIARPAGKDSLTSGANRMASGYTNYLLIVGSPQYSNWAMRLNSITATVAIQFMSTSVYNSYFINTYPYVLLRQIA